MTDAAPEEGEAESPEDAKPNWRRELEQKARRADELAEQVARLERREAFREAGVNISEGIGSYFAEGYKGDLTPEAIREEAEKIGLLGGQEQATAARVPEPDHDLSAEQRIALASETARPTVDAELNDLIRQTKNPDELRALMESKGYLWNAKV